MTTREHRVRLPARVPHPGAGPLVVGLHRSSGPAHRVPRLGVPHTPRSAGRGCPSTIFCRRGRPIQGRPIRKVGRDT